MGGGIVMGLTNFDLTESTKLGLEVQDEGVRLTVREETSDGERVAYSAIHARDFFESPQKRNTIANEIEENTRGDSLQTKAAFKQFCHRVSGNDLDTDRKELFRSEVVQQLLDETTAVNVYASENTTIEVTLSKNGSDRSIEFEPAEWTSSVPGKLAERYYNTFLERIEVQPEDWDDLVDEWEDMKEIASRETTTTWDAIVERVIAMLKKRHIPHESRDAFKNDEKTTWYEKNEDEATLWVRSSFVADLLEDAGKTPEELSELSKHLSKRDLTKGSTKKRSGLRAYPFDPEELEISENEVHTSDEGDEPEVEP